jgi:hypothetical protein
MAACASPGNKMTATAFLPDSVSLHFHPGYFPTIESNLEFGPGNRGSCADEAGSLNYLVVFLRNINI